MTKNHRLRGKKVFCRRGGKKTSWVSTRRRIFPRGLSFTPQGKIFTGISLGVGFAAINTGNNLLFLILGLLLGLIVVSGILSEITLRRVSVRRKVPRRVEEGVPFAVELTLDNHKTFAASFGVELRDEIGGSLYRRRCFFLRVGSQEKRSVAYRCEQNRRGRSRFGGTMVSTRFPFGLFEKRRFIALENDLIVLPGRIPVHVPTPQGAEGLGQGFAALPGMGQDFRELREKNDADDPRRIHWRATARMGEPFVVETERDAKDVLEIVLDPAVVGTGETAREAAEQNIRAAGTLIRDAAKNQVTTRLVTPGKSILIAKDQNAAVNLLSRLALMDSDEEAKRSPPMGESGASVLIGPRAAASGHSVRVAVPPVQIKAKDA